ncbi:MAG TPA: dihydrolipoamide acetyltransferase family protein [Mycobacteriales bacterium]|nr:dihydrolipoamide acetyltransferase family protein [Mycobacteriales bacterium]
MPTFRDFKLPDLGEGLTEGEILKWFVQPGDEVRLNQPIVEVETAKAAVEIPSPYAGVVSAVHHGEGETVDVGSPIITFDVDPSGSSVDGQSDAPANGAGEPPASGPPQSRVAAAADMVPQVPHEPGLVGSPAPKADSEEKIEVLVGTGPKSGKLTRRPRKSTAAADAPQQPARVSAAAVGARAAEVAGAAQVHVLAKPPVRKLARDLGVDLRSLTGSGPGGTITRTDVEAAADGGPAATPAPARVVDFDPATREQRIPIKGVRKQMAAAMVSSAYSAPHVTIFTTVDVTPMMETVERLKTLREFADLRVSPLLVVAKALLLAVKRNPLVNSTWDDAAQEIVVKDYVNLGIAAATPRGLIVPNIKDAGSLTLPELAAELQQLVTTARDGRTAPADMQGGTITITNVGVFGVDNGTPILNPGESAILCFGAVRDMPWVHDGALAVRKVTQLSLAFDHRIVDGQLGSQFLADVATMLADPALFLAWS